MRRGMEALCADEKLNETNIGQDSDPKFIKL